MDSVIGRRHARTAVVVGEIVGVVVVALVVALLIQTFVAQAFYIPSASMEPQLQINDRLVVSKLAYHLHAPRRGDIVVFSAPPGLEKALAPPNGLVPGSAAAAAASGSTPPVTDVVKRVVGLPGETVDGRNGHVFIDGRLLVEPYLPAGTLTSTFGPVVVPPGDLWVMGDNRNDSDDSRVFGPIPESTVIGRAIWRVWPLDHMSFL